MPSKKSGFRNVATPEDDIRISSYGVKGKTRLFFVAIAVQALLWLIGSFL